MTQKEKSYPQRRCSVCGAELPPITPPELCPKCLLKTGLPTQTGPIENITATVPSPDRQIDGKFKLGDQFGHYKIERLLGQGGMGAVYAAEDLESGRRMALKIMNHKLDSPEARARFLREGRLAAALNHPNSVYIYGTEEVAGIPVISMELVPGGTLQERVHRKGPLPISEAVDCILQVIDGLEAAQEVGILHRDVKPSNCFVDDHGIIKIGDFGLSISSAIRLEPMQTNTGAILGTPAFSSPEQLRGDELTVRSDIYSVGITLYYLLTGKAPFEAPNLPQLIALALERRPESPAKLRAEIPSGLCGIILRCLEKNPEQRFRSYADLRKALLAYSSTVLVPASLLKRFLAGLIDNLIFELPSIFTLFLGHPFLGLQVISHDVDLRLIPFLGLVIIVLPYYTFLEGLRGASLGKVMCGLRVTRMDQTLPGIRLAFCRAAIFLSPQLLKALTFLSVIVVGSDLMSSFLWILATSPVPIIVFFLLFVTARRRNGFAGLHDLASGTRVVQKPAYTPRQIQPADEAKTLSAPKAMSKIGPYYVLDTLARNDTHEFLLGYDDRLLRKVWILKATPETPPISLALCSLGRSGRLRWLNGKRSATENWDAWEALTGRPLLQLIQEKQSWSKVRFWILDLAEELRTAQADGTLPATLNLGQIWITADGRAKLLDFPAPGIEEIKLGPEERGDYLTVAGLAEAGPGSTPPATTFLSLKLPQQKQTPASPQEFLRQVAMSAIEGHPIGTEEARQKPVAIPLALHARNFLDALPKTATLKEAIERLKPLLNKPAVVSRMRRFVLVAAFVVLPVYQLIAHLGSAVVQNNINYINYINIIPLSITLEQLKTVNASVQAGNTNLIANRDALEIYIAGNFRLIITNASIFNNSGVSFIITPEKLQLAEKIIARRSIPSEKELSWAMASVKKQMGFKPYQKIEKTPTEELKTEALAMFLAYLFIVVIFAFIVALVFRGGLLMSLTGITVINRDGTPASRWRVFWRNLIAVMPLMLLIATLILFDKAPEKETTIIIAGFLGVQGILAIISLILPNRSLQDRLAGTWLVPR